MEGWDWVKLGQRIALLKSPKICCIKDYFGIILSFETFLAIEVKLYGLPKALSVIALQQSPGLPSFWVQGLAKSTKDIYERKQNFVSKNHLFFQCFLLQQGLCQDCLLES